MYTLMLLAIRSILSSVIGSSFYQWFKNTQFGVWFQDKIDDFMEYVADKYDIDLAKREEKWLSQYPKLAERILRLEKDSHPKCGIEEFDGYCETIDALDERIKILEKKRVDLK